MKKKILIVAIVLTVMAAGCRSLLGKDSLRLYDLEADRTLVGEEALDRLRETRIVVVGEQHTNAAHHRAQLAVVQALHQAGKQIAIGLEMFRDESQADLERWVSGAIEEPAFEPIYLDNWNFDWDLYRPIFLYARQQNIPMLGLNVPRNLSSQVAHHGFKSLSDEQRAGLNAVVCDVTPQYREFIRQAYGAHAHGAMQFENFCEAQLLWDVSMAKNAVDYLNAHPEATLVLLAGSGHARKMGIPTQVQKLSALPVVVLLPETHGIFEVDNTSEADADYLIRP
jgi:uncharacterized iron-regulated protein